MRERRVLLRHQFGGYFGVVLGHEIPVLPNRRNRGVLVARNNLGVNQHVRVAFGVVPAFGEQLQHVLAADEGQVGQRNVEAQVHGVPGEGRAGGVGADADHRFRIRRLQDVHLVAHDACELGAALVGRLAHDLFAVACQRLANARPAASTVGVRLVEDGDAASSDGHEVVDETGGFLPVGGPQVECEVAVGRFALGCRAGEREEQVHVAVLELLQERQHPCHRRRADIAEEQEHLVLDHERGAVRDRRIGLVAVVVDLLPDTTAGDATGTVNVLEVGHRSPVQLDAQTPRRTGECR